MIVYRHGDSRFPFLWEDADQPAARWHGDGEGPAHYFADTPNGAWAEFLRHEEIVDAADLDGIRRALWVVELPDLPTTAPRLPDDTLLGGPETYPVCRDEASRLRAAGAGGLVSPSAALKRGGATGYTVRGGLQPGPARDGVVYALFGSRPDLVGWRAVDGAAPPAEILDRVRHFETRSA